MFPIDAGNVLGLTVFNGELYACGGFEFAGSVPASRIAKWNGTIWSAVGAGMDNTVQEMAEYNGELYACGVFTTAGGNSSPYISKWNGSTWNIVGLGVNGRVRTLAVYNSELFAGGDFSYAGGNPTRFIAKWDGVSWSDVGLGVDSMVASFCVFNHALYVGGFFLNAGGNNANHIAKWLSLAGIDDTSELSEIDLFPNPTNSFLHIKNPKLNNSKLHLYNLVGDCVLFLDNLNPEEQVIDISFLSNGIYFAKITIKERTTIRKISLIK